MIEPVAVLQQGLGVADNLFVWNGEEWLCVSCEFTQQMTRPNRESERSFVERYYPEKDIVVVEEEGYEHAIGSKHTFYHKIIRRISTGEILEETSTPPEKPKAE